MAFLIYLEKIHGVSSAKKAGTSSIDLTWSKKVDFVWKRLHLGKDLWKSKGNKSCLWHERLKLNGLVRKNYI